MEYWDMSSIRGSPMECRIHGPICGRLPLKYFNVKLKDKPYFQATSFEEVLQVFFSAYLEGPTLTKSADPIFLRLSVKPTGSASPITVTLLSFSSNAIESTPSIPATIFMTFRLHFSQFKPTFNTIFLDIFDSCRKVIILETFG